MITEGNEPKWGDPKRGIQKHKLGLTKRKRGNRNTYSREAVETAENMRNRGVTG